ncbi:MAG TPA: DUF4998 domain-containing protein [Bacteroidales bacterium]|nr:DUF4998 domain-containing protein [Bacteroidales bacterium]
MIKNLTKVLISALFLLVSCNKMDDNYSRYLEIEHVYSPKVTNLIAVEGLREATLYWENPQSDIAKKIFIDYGDDSLLFETMADSAVLTGLEIKGYTVSVYTLDAFDNRSVPETISIFPNGEN